MGLQPETITWANGHGQTKLFVMPSTSGIVSAYQKPDKLKQVERNMYGSLLTHSCILSFTGSSKRYVV
jgi:hypothetical protein